MAKSFKRVINMEKAARLEALGWRDAEIARQLGISPAGLAMVKQDPDYPSVRDRIKTGVCSELDEVMKDDANYVRERLRGMIPQALDGLFENAIQTKDARIRQAACTEILDRDGRLAKVQRIGLPTEDQGGVGMVDAETADALAAALQTVKQNIPVDNAKLVTDKIQ
jgi:hypothetical protein